MTSTESSRNNAGSIFKYNHHAGIIYEKLLGFYKGNEMFDTIIMTGEESNRVSLQAHRLVLSSLSEYFLATFRDAQTVSERNVLVFEEIESMTLKLIIDFMYTGSIELTIENAEGILRAASFLKMEVLVDGCCDFIEDTINCSNCLAWFRVAAELDLYRLKAESKASIYKHFNTISKEKEFCILTVDELKDLLFNDNPNGDLEEYIVFSVVEWINYDKVGRDRFVAQLFSMLRPEYLSPKFIIDNRKLICIAAECQELIFEWLQWHLSGETKPIDQQSDVLTHKMVHVDEEMHLAMVDISHLVSNEIVIQMYNPTKNLWSVEKQIHFPKSKNMISTIVIDDRLIVVGGSDSTNLAMNSVECLDLHTFKWTDCRPILYYRSVCQLADLNGHLCVFGGFDRGTFIGSIEMHNISTRKIHELKPLSQPTHTSKIAAHKGILYILDIFGGCLQSYDITSKEWTSKSIVKDVLCNFGFIAVDGFLYVIGGEKGTCLQKSVKRYNLSNDSWSEVTSLPYPCSYIKSTIFKNKIVICAKTILNDDVIAEYNIGTDRWNVLSPFPMERSIQSSNVCALKFSFN